MFQQEMITAMRLNKAQLAEYKKVYSVQYRLENRIKACICSGDGISAAKHTDKLFEAEIAMNDFLFKLVTTHKKEFKRSSGINPGIPVTATITYHSLLRVTWVRTVSDDEENYE